jgi:hypothetical protein
VQTFEGMASSRENSRMELDKLVEELRIRKSIPLTEPDMQSYGIMREWKISGFLLLHRNHLNSLTLIIIYFVNTICCSKAQVINKTVRQKKTNSKKNAKNNPYNFLNPFKYLS